MNPIEPTEERAFEFQEQRNRGGHHPGDVGGCQVGPTEDEDEDEDEHQGSREVLEAVSFFRKRCTIVSTALSVHS